MKKPYRYPGGLEYTDPALSKCRKCGAIILECNVGGLPTKTDPLALTIHGQISARELDRELFEVLISRLGNSAEIVERDEARIRANKPHVAVASHSCSSGEATPPEERDPHGQARIDSWLYPAHPARSNCVEPPF